MCAQITSKGVSSLIGYTYPVLHKGVRWYVDFFAMDPDRNEMRRKRYYINGELKKSEKIRRAAEIIEALTKQLMTGWNPFIAVNEERGYILFEEVIEKYLLAVEKKDRKKTRDSYRSRVNIMKEYIAQCTLPIRYAYQLMKHSAMSSSIGFSLTAKAAHAPQTTIEVGSMVSLSG